MIDDPYIYPGSSVLRNKLGIREGHRLDQIERQLVVQRVAEGAPDGSFGLDHLRAIHRHLFQDVYDWAGELRTVEIARGNQQFQFRQYIETGMADIHRRIVGRNFLKGLERVDFAVTAGEIVGDVNYVHPFRDGNGRAQLQYIRLLAEHAGHRLDLTRLEPSQWIDASRTAHGGDYRLMVEALLSALDP